MGQLPNWQAELSLHRKDYLSNVLEGVNLAGRECASTVNAGTPEVQCGILWEFRTPDGEYACLNLYHSEVVDSS